MDKEIIQTMKTKCETVESLSRRLKELEKRVEKLEESNSFSNNSYCYRPIPLDIEIPVDPAPKKPEIIC